MISSNVSDVVHVGIVAASMAAPWLQEFVDFLPAGTPWWAAAVVVLIYFGGREVKAVVTVYLEKRSEENARQREHELALERLRLESAEIEANARRSELREIFGQLDTMNRDIGEMKAYLS